MARKYTNSKGVSLPIALWLANDEYDHDERKNVLSVSSLLKSNRQIILTSRLAPGEGMEDVSALVASRLGTAIHDAIERAWVSNYVNSMAALGYPKRVIEQLRINPTEVGVGEIPIYLEQRKEKVVGNWIISGKYDLICDGYIMDVKSTGVSTYLKGYKDEDYILQCSLYRWLNQDKVTRDHLKVQFIFKDWSLLASRHTKDYPPLPILEYTLPLMSLYDTEQFLRKKLGDLNKYWGTPEPDLPLCTDKELWIRDIQWKHYASPDSKRATPKGTFDNKADAQTFLLNKGKGLIKEVKSAPLACMYCKARSRCSQYAGFVKEGIIK